MVSDGADHDRGQVLLAGAVVIALAVLALVVVVNTTVVTNTATGTSAVEQRSVVREVDYEARRNAKALTVRTSHGGNYTSQAELRTSLDATFERYSALLAESHVTSGAGYVNVSVRDVPSEGWGTLVRQPTDRQLVAGNGTEDWRIVDNQTHVGWFVVNLNATAIYDEEPVVIRASNGSTDGRVTVVRNASTGVLRVNATVAGNSSEPQKCAATGGRLALDLLEGESLTGSCHFSSFASIEGPFTVVEIEEGANALGQYELVAENASATTVPPCDGDVPCRGPVPWTIQVGIEYSDQTMQYQRNVTIDVYGRSG